MKTPRSIWMTAVLFTVSSPLAGGRASAVAPDGGGGNWGNIGPETGTILSLAIDPVSPSTLYAGTVSGIFKTSDGGAD